MGLHVMIDSENLFEGGTKTHGNQRKFLRNLSKFPKIVENQVSQDFRSFTCNVQKCWNYRPQGVPQL